MSRFISYLYALFLVIFVIYSYLFVDPNLFYLKNLYTGFSSNQRILTSVLYVIFISIFFSFYILFLKNAYFKKISKNNLKSLLIITLVLLISYPAILSYDIFNYMTTAKVSYYYKESPYLVMPIEFINDPSLLYTRAANKFALYGPFWIILTSIPYVLGFTYFLPTLLFFKSLSVLFYFGIVLLIYKLSNKNIFSTIFFALNPLIVIETFVSGHNDAAMMFFALLSFFFIKKKHIWLAFIFIFLSILIKFATIFLIPVFLFAAYKQFLGRKISWNLVWLWAGILMFVIFIFSPIREEIYPWYAIWFFPFASLLEGYRKLKAITVVLSCGLMLSYVPYMIIGDYLSITFISKHILIVFPILFISFYFLYENLSKKK